MKNKVTVVIPFYNTGKPIVEAVESVLNQTYKDWEMILINDHSTDNTVNYIKKYLKNSRIRLIENPVNIGQSKTLNVGLRKTRTPYILQLDSDDWLEPDTIETMTAEMEQQAKDVAVVSGNMNIVWENSKGITKRTKVRKGRQFKDKYDFLLANTSVWPRFYRKKALDKVGGWSTNVPYNGRYAEDILILMKLAEHYRFHWIDKVLYHHRRHKKNLTHNIKEHRIVKKTFINKILKRWGNEYKPVFSKNDGGWLILESLEKKMIK